MNRLLIAAIIFPLFLALNVNTDLAILLVLIAAAFTLSLAVRVYYSTVLPVLGWYDLKKKEKAASVDARRQEAASLRERADQNAQIWSEEEIKYLMEGDIESYIMSRKKNDDLL